ncbi:hypothetical protein ACFLR0_02015 [Candidatus Bipolaricaulota bacterium]
MNNRQNGTGGSGHLMGQVNYDAGIMRYRQLLSRSHNEAVESQPAAGQSSRLQRAIRVRRQRRIAASAAALLLVLSIGVAGVAQGNCLRLCSGFGGFAAEVYSVESPSPALIAAMVHAEGELSIESSAWGGGGGCGNVVECGGYAQFIP